MTTPTLVERIENLVEFVLNWHAVPDDDEYRNVLADVRELQETLRNAGKFIDESITFEQSSYDSPPEPRSRWDYEACMICSDIDAALTKTGAI